MHFFQLVLTGVALALMPATAAFAADAELDALALESATETAVPTARSGRDLRFFVEGATGNANQRYQTGSRSIGRISVDFSFAVPVAPGLRAIVSDRVDYMDPSDQGTDATVNSLREAHVSWQGEGGAGANIVEFGRINLRYGPGYGYNPTDFFRDGSLRTQTTANPFAMRENRLGSIMLRGQHLWSGGSLSLAYSPKLADEPSPDGWNVDLGATNNRNRALLVLGTQFSPTISSQLLAYKEAGRASTLGASATALLSDAATAHLEFTRGSEPDLLSRGLGLPDTNRTRNRFVAGMTYTTLGKLSVTAEYQYNGFALSESDWAALRASPPAQEAYLREAQRSQDLAARQAYLVYVTQKSLGLKDLDLTAFLRVNAVDQSKMAWVELRHHWPSFDLALQVQRHLGEINSEFGILPDSRLIQVLGTYYY